MQGWRAGRACALLATSNAKLRVRVKSLSMPAPPFFIRAFGAAALLLVVASLGSAQTKSSSWIKGTWEGIGYQIDDQSTWTMRFVAGGRRFSTEYPSLNCGGRWKLISINAYRARFKEKLDHGQDNCVDNSSVVIQRLNKRQVVFFFSYPGKREVYASGILKRKPVTR